jgi:glycosyltransferase involved in cell wall biosynthesis
MQNAIAPLFPKSLSVVVPVYNEKLTLELVVEKLIKIVNPLEIIVVDDGSKDGTNLVLQNLCLKYKQIYPVYHDTNKGKTSALIAGFALTSGDIVIVQDADLEYNPEEISIVIEPILSGEADVVYGSRFLVRKAARVLYFYHFLGNKFLTFLSNLLTNVNMTDVETGYKAFKGEIIRNMVIISSRFGFEIEVTAKIAKLNCRIYEVPISYYGRTYEEGKKIGFKDGIWAIWYIVYFNLFCSLESSFVRSPKRYLG